MPQPSKSTNWKAGLGLSLITACLWGLLPIIMKGALKDFDTVTATWFRFTGGASLFGMWLMMRKPEALRPHWHGRKKWLFPLAILCMSGNFLLLTWSLEFNSPSVTQTLLQIGPPMVFLGGAFFFRESIGRLQWLGLFLLLPGLALFFNTKLPQLLSGRREHITGMILIAISAVCFASYSICQKALMPEIRPETIVLWGLIGGILVFLPFAHPEQIFQAGRVSIILLGFAILNTFLPFFCYGEALRIWEVSRVGAIVAMPPLVTMFATGLVSQIIPNYIQSEHLNLYSIFGIFVFVSGCVLGALGRAKPTTVTTGKINHVA